MKDLKKIQEFFSKPLKEEGELKLGIKYDYKYGDSGYISTGGSKDPRDWKFLSGNKPIKYSYLDVKADLVPSEKQPGKYDGAFDMGLGKGHHIDEANGFTSGKQMLNIKFKNYPKAVAKINQLIDMIGESNFTMEMAEWIWDFFNNAHFERPVYEATKDEETKFHTKLDKLVHDTFGKRKGEMEEGMGNKDREQGLEETLVKKVMERLRKS